jgi:UDP-glucuronate 4-epimerase
MKCLVTGGAGFIGSSIVDALLAQSAEVIAVDAFVDYYPREFKERNLLKAKTNKNFSFVEGDLNDLDLKTLIKGVDVIFHQAAQAGVRASWGEQFQDYTAFNVLATQKILEAARSSNTIKQIVYASSSSVYGDAERYPTVETDLPKPRSPYGVTKLAAEHLMVLYAKQFHLPTVSLRYFTVYGPRQRPDMAFHRFIRAGLTGQPITVYGDGEQMRDFTYIDDIVAANLAAAKFQQKGYVFNLGGGTDISVNDVLKILTNELGELNIIKHPPQPGDVFRTGADTSLAKTHLGFAPSYDLTAGLKNEISWLKTII